MTEQSKAITPKERTEERKAELVKFKPAYMDVLAGGVGYDNLIRNAITCLTTKPELLKCSVSSFNRAVFMCAQFGLVPGTPLGQCHLVPYKGEVVMIPGYRGLADLARRSGKIVSIQAEAIREKDDFDFLDGTDGHISHKKYIGTEDPGPLVAAWAMATYTNGTKHSYVMPGYKIIEIRDKSPAYIAKKGPWIDWEEEQWRKTAVKNLSKHLPLSPDDLLAKAIHVDNAAETGEPIDTTFVDVPEAMKDPEPVSGTKTDRLADKVDALAGKIKSKLTAKPRDEKEPPTPKRLMELMEEHKDVLPVGFVDQFNEERLNHYEPAGLLKIRKIIKEAVDGKSREGQLGTTETNTKKGTPI